MLRFAAACALLLAACRHAPEAAPPALKLAVFPVQNASGGLAPIRPLSDEFEKALSARGLDVVDRNALDVVLAQHRIRFTGGVDQEMAKVLREELGVDAVLVPTLELFSTDDPPKISLAARLVSTSDRPTVLWADALSRSGDDSPGVLSTGLEPDPRRLQMNVVSRVANDVARWAADRAMTDNCGEAGRFTPRRRFRAPLLDDVGRRTVAVLPFTNETRRRAASDVLMGQFVAQLVRSNRFEVLDPGFVRQQLLSHRIVLEGGVSVDHAMAMLDLLDADLVLSGYVQVFEARAGRSGPPKVEFSAYVIDRAAAELVWSSTSSAEGDDGVWFFGAGRVHTATNLSCRMARGVVDGIVGKRPPLEPAR